jgi:DNA modification methylase
MRMPKPYYEDSVVTIYLDDCWSILPLIDPVDLIVTDPPYGINAGDQRQQKSRGKLAKATDYGVNDWDKETVPQWLIDSIVEKSKYCVVWGGNYYKMPPCKGPLVWDKENTGDFADGEIAWNNYCIGLRIKRHLWNGMIRKGREPRFHITQKPLEIITWSISLCPVKPKMVLDPFLGSGTTLRAAKDLRIQAVGIEKSERDCEIAANRMRQEVLEL